jgi:hypothetical protein
MLARAVLAAALLWGTGLSSSALRAQERSASFRFEGASIEVRILSGGLPGSAELVDGEPATLSVADRAARGGTSMRLEGAVLIVENRSGAPADYRISAPPTVDVALVVDGRTVLSVAAATGGRRIVWSWSGREGRPLAPVPREVRKRRRRGFRVTAYTGASVADSVDVAYPERLRALTILLGAEAFRVSGDRSVRFAYDEEIRWGVIAPRADRAEVTLELPADVEHFKVRVDDGVVWELKAGRGRAYCEPVAEVRRPDGTRLWVFTPDAGRLDCPAAPGGPPSRRLVRGAMSRRAASAPRCSADAHAEVQAPHDQPDHQQREPLQAR